LGAEIVGVVCLVLALIGLGVLNIDYVGLVLILIGVVLLVVELLNPTHGVLGIASVVCIALGSLMLFREPLMPKGFYEGFKFFVIGVSLGFASFMTYAIIKVTQIRRVKVKVGRIEDEKGEIIEFKDGKGLVKVRGEIWSCVSDEDLCAGDSVIVTGREGLTLRVKRL
jgi:membrane-bound serine protease (ClpP class)